TTRWARPRSGRASARSRCAGGSPRRPRRPSSSASHLCFRPAIDVQSRMMRARVWCLGLLLLVGCGSDVSVSMPPLSGKIGGNPWTFGVGETNSFLSMADSLFVNLYSGSFASCASAAPVGADSVIMQMPTKPGSYDLSLQLNATLYVGSTSSNYVATSGKLRIDSVTATTISGGLNASYNGANAVDGMFQAAICP